MTAQLEELCGGRVSGFPHREAPPRPGSGVESWASSSTQRDGPVASVIVVTRPRERLVCCRFVEKHFHKLHADTWVSFSMNGCSVKDKMWADGRYLDECWRTSAVCFFFLGGFLLFSYCQTSTRATRVRWPAGCSLRFNPCCHHLQNLQPFRGKRTVCSFINISTMKVRANLLKHSCDMFAC